DPLGQLNQQNLQLTFRSDGLAVRTSKPLRLADKSIKAMATEANPTLVAGSATNYAGMDATYVVATRKYDGTAYPTSFSAAEFGYSGSVYVYDYYAGTGQVVQATDTFERTIGASSNG